ncbi:hypothetical protein [Aliivibrio fischeri]|uniref:hypothetical protein n=1 Tax=Aliivibrio fischeri TaxID=668 RepID=UPI00105F51B1|nr:hypothetical protein [Aliivibrio fischeri]MUJ22010.1 hypothetical protein [Aliivibrio fischeri]TDM51482.1 hypothetical protein VFFQA001_15320 [Aliivibrio fischeri]
MSEANERDIQAVVSSIMSMAMDCSKPLTISVTYVSMYNSIVVNVFKDSKLFLCGPSTVAHYACDLGDGYCMDLMKGEKVVENSTINSLLKVESRLADLIIEAKDNAEVTA